MMLLKRGSTSISDHLFACNRRPSASETTALSLLDTFNNTLRLRLLSLLPAPHPLTLPYLSRALDILASTHADARDLLSHPAVLSSYLDASVLLLDACNAILVEIERLRHGHLHLRLASCLLLNRGDTTTTTTEARASIHEWDKRCAISVADQRAPTFLHGRKGLTASSTLPAIASAIYAVETVSWLVAGTVMSAIGGGGVPRARVPVEFAWAGAYNELSARIGCGGGLLEEKSAVGFSVGRLRDIIDGDGDTEKMGGAVTELEGTVGRMTEGLERLGNAVDGLFRRVMAIRTTALCTPTV